MKYLFVGERPSFRAEQIGATWQNGMLAGKTLHDALKANNIDPNAQLFINLWIRAEKGYPTENQDLLANLCTIQTYQQHEGYVVVGMGKIVCAELNKVGISHISLTHPAARGTIRLKSNYISHVANMLLAGVQK